MVKALEYFSSHSLLCVSDILEQLVGKVLRGFKNVSPLIGTIDKKTEDLLVGKAIVRVDEKDARGIH